MKSRTLQFFAPVVLASLLLQAPAAFALSGGPFDNGYAPGATASGSYSGVITGKNLVGIVQFGVSDSTIQNATTGATVTPVGRFSVFHEGFLATGTCDAIADPSSQRIAGTLDGTTDPVTTTGNTLDSSTNIPIFTGDVNFPDDTAFSGFTAQGAFTAEMKGFPIAITFEGEGQFATVANPTTTTNITDGGTITITSGGSADSDNQANDPQILTTDKDARVLSTASRATTSFEIRGSRTSLSFAAN